MVSGELPPGLPADVIPIELRQQERGLRGQLLDAYRAAAEACRKSHDNDFARALEFEAKQRSTENDRNELRGVEFLAEAAPEHAAAAEAGWRRSGLLARFEQRVTTIASEPSAVPFRAAGEEFEFEITAKHQAGSGPLCATLSRKGEPSQSFETWQSQVGDTVTLRLRVRKEGVNVDLAHALPSLRPGRSAGGATLTLWSPDGKYGLVAVRSKPIRPADSIQGPAQAVAGTATVARGVGAAKADDAFAVGRTWTGRWQASECSITVTARGDDTMTLRVMRGDGSIWDFRCATALATFRITSIEQVKAAGRQQRPLVSEETGVGQVQGNKLQFNFRARTKYPRGKFNSIEGPVHGAR